MVEIDIQKTLTQDPSKLEAKILKAIFKRNNSIIDVIDIVTPQMFTVSEYSSIYTSMVTLYKKDIAITPETIQNELETSGLNVENKIIDKLYNESYTSIKIKNIALMLKEIYQRRFILESMREVLDKQESKPTTVTDILENINDFTIKANEIVINQNVMSKCVTDTNMILSDIINKINCKVTPDNMKSGFRVIDEDLYGFKPGQLWTICADSQVGKSMLALQFALNVCKLNKDVHVLYYSLEMTHDELVNRAIGMLADIEPSIIEDPVKYFKHFDNKTSRFVDKSNDPKCIQDFTSKIKNALDELKSYNLYIDDTADHDILTLEASVRKYVLKHGRVDMIIVDHMNILCSGTVSDEVGKLKEGYATLKKIAKKFNAVSVCLHQMSNELKHDEMRKPNIFNLIGGSAPRHYSDVIGALYRPNVYREVIEKHPELKDYCDITWQKVRGAKKPDVTQLSFNGYMFKEKGLSQQQQDIINGDTVIELEDIEVCDCV